MKKNTFCALKICSRNLHLYKVKTSPWGSLTIYGRPYHWLYLENIWSKKDLIVQNFVFWVPWITNGKYKIFRNQKSKAFLIAASVFYFLTIFLHLRQMFKIVVAEVQWKKLIFVHLLSFYFTRNLRFFPSPFSYTACYLQALYLQF